jgi:hypothetical protein
VSYTQVVVIQKYIERPYLLRGHKFDLRLYVVVTSFSPLEAFIYTRGFVRLSTVPFSLDIARIHALLLRAVCECPVTPQCLDSRVRKGQQVCAPDQQLDPEVLDYRGGRRQRRLRLRRVQARARLDAGPAERRRGRRGRRVGQHHRGSRGTQE